MYHVNRRLRQVPQIVIVVVLRGMLFRRWMAEVAIVSTMLVLLLVELGLRLMPGTHTAAYVVIWGLLFGLIALWLYHNRSALAAWERQDAEERDNVC